MAAQPVDGGREESRAPELLAGLDEAGRGAALGPLVVAVVFATHEQTRRLTDLGISDSKKFGSDKEARARRRSLAQKIQEIASAVRIAEASAARVDAAVQVSGLNRLEQEMALQLFANGPEPSQAVADGERLFSPLKASLPFLQAINKADETHPLVAAASIVAKDRRDDRITSIYRAYSAEFGIIGGNGYANASTERFLRAYHRKYNKLPTETRLQWQWDVIQELSSPQQKLFDL